MTFAEVSPGQVLVLRDGIDERSKAARKRPGRLSSLAKLAPSTRTGKPTGRESVVVEGDYTGPGSTTKLSGGG